MNIRFVRRRHGSQTVLAELYDVSLNELPAKNEEIILDGTYQRVLNISKSYEILQFKPNSILPLKRVCWFEVDIT